MISTLQQTVLNMLSSALLEKEYSLSDNELNTSELISECREQGILYLISDMILPICSNEKDKYGILGSQIRHNSIASGILEAQDELFAQLFLNGFHPLLLKGWAAAKYYPKPQNRTFGDIDVLFPENEFYQAVEWMLNNGFVYRDENPEVDHHIALKKNDIVVEPHIAVAGLPEDQDKREFLEKLFADGLSAPLMQKLQGYEVPLFPELQNGLVLLLHIRGHLRGGLGLRQIADWMAYVRFHLDDDAYQTQWRDVLEKSGLDKLAKVSTALCVRYLGLQGHYTWCESADSRTVDTMLRFIFAQGNFGHKKRNTDVGAKSISKSGGFIGFMKQLYRSGVHHWSIRNEKTNPKTRPILRIFAWFYGLGHYISKLHKKGGLPYLFKSYSEARKRRNFFSSLGIYD